MRYYKFRFNQENVDKLTKYDTHSSCLGLLTSDIVFNLLDRVLSSLSSNLDTQVRKQVGINRFIGSDLDILGMVVTVPVLPLSSYRKYI